MAAEAHLAGLISRPGICNGRQLLARKAATKATPTVNAKHEEETHLMQDSEQIFLKPVDSYL